MIHFALQKLSKIVGLDKFNRNLFGKLLHENVIEQNTFFAYTKRLQA